MSSIIAIMDRKGLNDWVFYGLGIFCPLSLTSKTIPHYEDECFVALPAKYEQIIKGGFPFYVLVDDVEWISLFTEEATLETQVGLRNLGESWLPFAFHPEVGQLIITAYQGENVVKENSEEVLDTHNPILEIQTTSPDSTALALPPKKSRRANKSSKKKNDAEEQPLLNLSNEVNNDIR